MLCRFFNGKWFELSLKRQENLLVASSSIFSVTILDIEHYTHILNNKTWITYRMLQLLSRAIFLTYSSFQLDKNRFNKFLSRKWKKNLNNTKEYFPISNNILQDSMSLRHNVFNLEDAFNFITTNFSHKRTNVFYILISERF